MRRRADSRKADIGKAIVLLAHLLGMSQKQLARKIRMSEQAISEWCRGLSSPSPQALDAVLRALWCTWRDVEEVMAFILVWRLKLEGRRAAQQLDANIEERSGPPGLPGSVGASSSLGPLGSPGLSGGPSFSTEDERLWEIGRLLTRLQYLLAPPPDRKRSRRR